MIDNVVGRARCHRASDRRWDAGGSASPAMRPRRLSATSIQRIMGYQQALEEHGHPPRPGAAVPQQRDLPHRRGPGRRHRAGCRRSSRRAGLPRRPGRDRRAARPERTRPARSARTSRVTGWDNIELSRVTFPSLTTIAPDLTGLARPGRADARRADRGLHRRRAPRTRRLHPRWCARAPRAVRSRRSNKLTVYSAAYLGHAGRHARHSPYRRCRSPQRTTARYPRPQLVRSQWRDLSGRWGFAFDDDDRGLRERLARAARLSSGEIVVPFPPESSASEVQRHQRSIGCCGTTGS